MNEMPTCEKSKEIQRKIKRPPIIMTLRIINEMCIRDRPGSPQADYGPVCAGAGSCGALSVPAGRGQLPGAGPVRLPYANEL